MLKSALKTINTFIPFSSQFPLNYMIPVYHVVSNEKLPHVRNIINYKNSYDFEKDLDYLLKRFDFLDWENFKIKHNSKNKKPYALLTFDDGLIEFKEIVVPILMRKGIYAINFINPPFIGNSDMMFRMKASLLIEEISKTSFVWTKSISAFLELKVNSKIEAIAKIKAISYNNRSKLIQLSELIEYDFQEYLKNCKIYMDEKDLSYVKEQGFGIAAHSWNHPYFFDLCVEEQLEEAQKSIDYIRGNNFLSETFAFPFSDMGVKRIFFEKLFEKNEDLKYTFGTSGIKLDDFSKNLHRVAMENGNTAERELNFENNYYKIKSIFNKNLINRK